MTAGSLAAAPVAAEPDAPAAPAVFTGSRYNHIALPLDPGTTISPFNARGLLNYMGAGATQVANLNPNTGGLDFWDETNGFGLVNNLPIFNPVDYPLTVGHPYLVLLDSSYPANKLFSIVGGVPDVGQVSFTLVGGTPCVYNEIIVPLDQYSQNLTDAVKLANAIGNVNVVASLYTQEQGLDFWDIQNNFGLINNDPIFSGTDFPVKLGYPYFVCVNANGNGDVWP